MPDPTLLKELVEAGVLVITGGGGLYGVQKGVKYFKNGNGKPMSLDEHERLCPARLAPMQQMITDLHNHFFKDKK